jgi:ribosome hibernation promoting factor
MKVHYTGKLKRMTPAEEKRLETRFSKLGKLIDRRSEKEAHVILADEKVGHRAEVTVNYYDHPLAGKATGKNQLAALTGSLDRLEKQILKLQNKRRDTKRRPAPEISPEPGGGPDGAQPRVYRVVQPAARKPMTAEEAVLVMGDKSDYLVYRDADRDRTSVLIRRRDGHLDLIEA